MAENKLYRSETDKLVAGVCGGFAEVHDYDPSLVRVITLLIILVTFPLGLFAYLAAWLIIPHESEIN